MRHTQDDQVQAWSELLTTAREDGSELAGAAPLIEALEDFHIQAVSLRSRRDALAASAQAATRQVNAAFAAGRDAAIALRSYIRAVLGPRSEKLLRYGIKPIRRRRRATHGRCGLPN
jgi:hypothetical protein